MPVSRTSGAVDWSTNSGGSAWIGRMATPTMGPRSSIGSPMTFMMRPRQAGPTGMRMGAPVSTTAWPRTRPSVPAHGDDKKKSGLIREPGSRKQRTVHGDGADRVLSQVHRNLEDEAVLEALDLERVEDRGKVVSIELDLHSENERESDVSAVRETPGRFRRPNAGARATLGARRGRGSRTSTTAPMTVLTLPVAPLTSVAYERAAERGKAGQRGRGTVAGKFPSLAGSASHSGTARVRPLG